MADPTLGEIKMFGGNFAPRGYAFCNGQLVAISSYSALFSLLGTTYGGNGTSTFGLPDLRSRVPIHYGTGPGLSSRTLGERGGAETVTLATAQMPTHTHQMVASTAVGTYASGANHSPAVPPSSVAAWRGSGTSDTTLATAAVATTGGNQPHNNVQPFLAISFIIALEGVFPSRN